MSANTLPDNTVAVYVEVKKGTTPVAGAQVTAIIVKNTDQKEWRLTLLDNGASEHFDSVIIMKSN